MQKYNIFLNLGDWDRLPAQRNIVQANITVLQLPIIESRVEILLGLARADGFQYILRLATCTLARFTVWH
jgi:hypothetical protein